MAGLAVVMIALVAIQYKPPGHGPTRTDLGIGPDGLDFGTQNDTLVDAPQAETPKGRRRSSSPKA